MSDRFEEEFKTRTVFNSALGEGISFLERDGEWSGLTIDARPTKGGKRYRGHLSVDEMAALAQVLIDELRLIAKKRVTA